MSVEAVGSPTAAASERSSYREIFTRFLRFGLLAWGGPVAQIAMLRRELVDEQRWVESGRFNRLLAVYQVLPGPEAHELSVHLGMLRGGRVGGLLAGLGFMLPGFALMFTMSWIYFRIDLAQPAVAAVFLGVQVGVLALVARAIHRIGSHAVTAPLLWVIAAVAIVASVAGAPFWLILPVAGAAHVAWARPSWRWLAAVTLVGLLALTANLLIQPKSVPTDPVAVMAIAPSALVLFLSGLKAGLLTFGGAYTVIPFVRDDAVGSGWITDARFLDGLALSGILPAPLIIFSTFVGYVANGPIGALAMTAGIFLPAFGFSLVLGDRLEAITAHESLHRFLDGVAAGVIGLIVTTAFELAIGLAGRVPSVLPAVLIFIVSLVTLFAWRAKLNVVVVIAASAAMGWLAFGGVP